MADVVMKDANKPSEPAAPSAPTAPTSDTDVLKELGYDVTDLTTAQIKNRVQMIENNIQLMKSEKVRIMSEIARTAERVKENNEKIKLNKGLPYLVANVVEVMSHLSSHTYIKVTQSRVSKLYDFETTVFFLFLPFFIYCIYPCTINIPANKKR